MNIPFFVAIILGGIFYRLGGMKGMNSKFRDFGVPLVFAGLSVWTNHFSWAMLVSEVLLFGALTTYWDFMFNQKDNFYMHGFMCGMAMLPLIFAGVSFMAVLVYALVLSFVMGFINYIVNKFGVPFRDWIEELSRGAIIIAALPILLI